MRKLIGAVSLALALGAPTLATAGSETTIEKKTTTTSPSGRIMVEDETKRTFKLEGHTETYTAPAGVDLNTYRDKEVTVQLNDDGSVTKIERKTTKTY